MTLYEFLNENRERYVELVRLGVINCGLLTDLDMYHFYKCQLRETGSKMVAVTHTADAFKKCERSVYYVIKRYGSEITTI